jgi:hypothetical protein
VFPRWNRVAEPVLEAGMGTKQKLGDLPENVKCGELLGRHVILLADVKCGDGKVFPEGSSMSIYLTHRGTFSLFNAQGTVRGVPPKLFKLFD